MNVAVELVSDPMVVLLDEPTTGLDPATEKDVVNSLRALANQGRTVVFVTHSAAVIDMLDHVVLMSGPAPEAPSLGGRVECQGSPEEIRRKTGAKSWGELFDQLRGKTAIDTRDLSHAGTVPDYPAA